MKIFKVVHSFVPYNMAGTEVYTYTLSKELAKRNEVFVFFRINKPAEKEYALTYNNLEGLKTYAINHTLNQCSSFEGLYSDRVIDKIWGSLLDETRPDIVHIEHLLFLSLGIISEAKKRNIPIVFTINDYWLFCQKGQLLKNDLTICEDHTKLNCQVCLISQLSIKKNTILFYNILRNRTPEILLQFIKKIYLSVVRMLFISPDKLSKAIKKRYDSINEMVSRVDLFIAPSKFIKEKFVEFGIPEEKIYFCPYGINYKNMYSPVKKRSAKLRFGYIGTLLPMKGVDILISAFKGIKNSDIQLSIYGKAIPYAGYEFYYKRLKKMVHDDKRINLMGDFDNKDVRMVMADIDMLVAPSIWLENYPLVIQEAFLAKKPVIASRIGGIPELVNDGVNGLLFNLGDRRDLKEKLEYTINNPDVIDNFKKNFPSIKSIEDNAREMEEIYIGLITKNKLDARYHKKDEYF